MEKLFRIICCVKKWIHKANEFIAKIWNNNKELMWEICIIIVSAICSVSCALLTQNIILTVIYIGVTAIIDIISVIESKMEGLINWDKIIGKVFKINNRIKYLVCLGFALLPTLLGIVFKEIAFSGIKDIPSIFFINLFPNVCGAAIVCSMVAHISKLDEKQFVSAMTLTKRNLFNIIIRLGFLTCYLNAVNYKVNDSWKWINLANSCYLFFIIFFGAIAAVSFFSRLIDNQPFSYTPEEVFPTCTLRWSTVYVFSCCAGPLIAKVGKHEPLLTFFITLIIAFVFGWLLWLISYRTKQKLKILPVIQFTFHMALDLLICLISFSRWIDPEDIMGQIMSGCLVLGMASGILLFLNYFRKNSNEPPEERVEMDD